MKKNLFSALFVVIVLVAFTTTSISAQQVTTKKTTGKEETGKNTGQNSKDHYCTKERNQKSSNQNERRETGC